VLSLRGAIRSLLCLLALGLLNLSCGEVYADLEVQTLPTAEPSFHPSNVAPNSVTWMTVKVRLDDAAQAWIEKHGFDGSQGVQLAYEAQGIEWFPGECPETELTFESVTEAQSGAEGQSPIGADGRYVFCTAVEVGAFAESTTLSIEFVFWDGFESVYGSGTLPVNGGAL